MASRVQARVWPGTIVWKYFVRELTMQLAMPQRLVAVVIWGIVTAALVALNIFQYVHYHEVRSPKQKLVHDFEQLYYNEDSWRHAKWLGIHAAQNPNDAWAIQEIICEVKPDFIVEAGTLNGGSALLWATVLEQVNPDGRIITIDIEDGINDAKQVPIFQRKVDFLLGSSTDPEILAQIAERVKDHRTLVILDSDHRKEHVLKELKAYGPMVSPGSYLIVQDTNRAGYPLSIGDANGQGPMEAVEEFLVNNEQFKPDRSREKFVFTEQPKGFLRRVH